MDTNQFQMNSHVAYLHSKENGTFQKWNKYLSVQKYALTLNIPDL